MRKPFFLLTFLLLFTGLFAQAPKNLSLISQVTYTTDLSDVWAYAAGGKEYALVGLFNGLSIVDITDPANPAKIHFIPGANSTWRDIKTFGDYAYVSNETANGVLIVNLSGLPGSISYKDTVMAGSQTIHNLWVADGYLYLAGMNNFNGGIAMFDLNANPWIPAFAGAYSETYVHDVYVRNNIAYAGEIEDGLLTIIDVSDKALPQIEGSRTYENAFTHNTWLNDAGNVCFSTDELANAYIYAWDVSDPTDIIELDRIRSSLSEGKATPHNAHVLNDYIITSYYKDGINIVDASRPHNLIEVGWYDTNNLTGGGTDGCWGAYPFLPSGNVLATDMSEGLFILSPTYTRGCYLEGIVTDKSTTNPISNVSVKLTTTNQSELTASTGSYATGLADAGTYTVTFEKFGYLPKTETVNLSNGVLTQLDVELETAPTVDFDIFVLDQATNQPIAGASVAAFTTGATFDYLTDGSGMASDNALIAANYDFIAGKWGYETASVNLLADPSNTSVTIYLKPGYYDDFLFNYNWSIAGNASSGLWEWGEPVGTYSWIYTINPEEDVQDDYGDKCYVTGNGGGGPGSDDIDNGSTLLTSPAFDLSGYTDPVINFNWWVINVDLANQGPENDYLSVILSDGTLQVEVARFDGFNNEWNFASVRVLDHLSLGTNMTLTFFATDDPPGHVMEAAIDKFLVYEAASTAINPQELASVNFNAFPNPVVERLSLDYDLASLAGKGVLSFDLIDMRGATVFSRRIDAGVGTMDFNFPWANGLYAGVLKLDGAPVKTIKILK